MHDTNSGFWSGLRDLNPRSLGPKPSAIPNFAKYRTVLYINSWYIELISPLITAVFSLVVVKTVVKQALTHKTGNAARGKVLEPQGKIAGRAN